LASRIQAEVVSLRSFGCASELVLEVPASFVAEPGQFVHVRCMGEGLILRRPFSLYASEEGTAALLVKEVGAGTAWLCNRKVGEKLDILGPLGRGFTIEGDGSSALVAGGAGIAPIRFLAARMRYEGLEPVVLWGVDKEDQYGELPTLLEKEMDLHLACMDGSRGYAGSVAGLFSTLSAERPKAIYACGPRGMLTALVDGIGEGSLANLQVSMEERMACGVGACRGCVVPAAQPDGGYLAACKDGPVFYGRELDWRRI
jgi:dihydroorotate dehydrogenase electron transfer subunit